LELEVSVTGFYDVPDNVEIGLYRVMQEGLNNVRKHSGSNQAAISIVSKPDELLTGIKDEGIGVDQKEKSGYSYGLGNLRDREKKSGGKLETGSKQGQGTAIKVSSPRGES